MEFGKEKLSRLIMTRGTRQITEAIELLNQGRIITPGEKEIWKYPGILEADKQAEMKEKIRRVPQTNEKTSRNQSLHQRNKHLSRSTCNMLGSILKMDKGRTQANGPEDKKVDEDEREMT